ncbi:MAG TPA: hypothetical protein VGF92_15810 [Stellaceae bacterium]|jgi:hypothetical protein
MNRFVKLIRVMCEVHEIAAKPERLVLDEKRLSKLSEYERAIEMAALSIRLAVMLDEAK